MHASLDKLDFARGDARPSDPTDALLTSGAFARRRASRSAIRRSTLAAAARLILCNTGESTSRGDSPDAYAAERNGTLLSPASCLPRATNSDAVTPLTGTPAGRDTHLS